MPSEDLFQAQRLFEAHDAMQLELSTSSSTSMSASPPLCQQIRDQYRRVHPLYAALTDKDAFGLFVEGDAFAPVYRDGDLLVVSPHASVRRGDRVLVKQRGGGILIRQLVRQTAHRIEFAAVHAPEVTGRGARRGSE